MSTTTPDFAQKLIEWQRGHGRHDLPWQATRDPYRIWVSEIMLQQTRVGAVTGYFQRFMDRFPDVNALAHATEDEVLRFWSGLGYYARARNLHKAAQRIVRDYGGKFPQTAQSIVQLPGIGRSTAAAIAAFSFGEREAILDGNVKRVLARCFGIEGFPGISSVESELWALAVKLLPKGRKVAAIETYTQGLMDLGATVCTRTKPSCEACPVAAGCIALKTGRIAHLPAPRPKKKYPTRLATWLVLRHREKVLLERRPSHGIWGGLWVFPEFAGADLVEYCRSEYGCVLSGHRLLPTFAHGFTHFRLEVSPVICTVGKFVPRAQSPGLAWSTVEEAGAAAVPAPVRKLLESL